MRERSTRRGVLIAALAVVVAGLVVAAVHRQSDDGVLRTVPLGSSGWPIMDTRSGHIFLVGATESPNGLGYTGHVATIDAKSGRILRTTVIGPNPVDDVLDTPAGRLYVTDVVSSTVSVIDTQTGRLVATIPVGDMPGNDSQRIAVDVRMGRVFVAGAGVMMLDALTGRVINTVIGGDGSIVVAERARHVFAARYGTGRDNINMLDAHSGIMLHSAHVAWPPLHLAVSEATGRVFVHMDTTGRAGLAMLDAGSGRVLRRAIPVGAARFASMTVDEQARRIIVANPDAATLSFLNARSGNVVRTVPVGWLANTPVIDERNGHVLVRTHSAILIFDARTGVALRTIPVPLDPSDVASDVAIDDHHGRLFVTSLGPLDAAGNPTDTGSLSVIDERAGRVLRTIPVGLDSFRVLVDTRTGRTLVFNGGGTLRQPDPWGWMPAWLRRRLPFVPQAAPAPRIIPASMSIIDTTR